ncbi:MAG TPA: hypothetical protein VGK32_21470 [Vicinamibacterales bacterium]
MIELRRPLLLVALVVVAVVVAIFAARRNANVMPSAPPPVVPCTVTIAEPAGGLASVQLEFDPLALGGRRELLLAFADARVTRPQVRSFSVTAAGRTIDAASDTYHGMLVRRVPLPDRGASVIVQYSIDPTFFPPGSDLNQPADARSRITGDLAVVRSASLLPIIGIPGAVIGVRFVLPVGWVAVTPWREDDDRILVPADGTGGAEYLALGPFDTRDLSSGTAVIHVVTPGLLTGTAFPIEHILRRELELVAAPIKRDGPFVAILVPDDFMHGGAAGPHTIVQSRAPEVLAHEVFHWWNDATLTAPDAGWFREGLTEYYGIKVAREADAWSVDDEAACLADLNAEMRVLERGGARSLIDASLDPAASRFVYSKGALFWLLVDRRLHASGRYLEEAVRRVVTSPRQGLTANELRSVFSTTYGGLLDAEFDEYVFGSGPLPDLELGLATGRSGCARSIR